MQRILLLIPSLVGIGGTERMVHSLTTLLDDSQREVIQASFDSPGIQKHFNSTAAFYTLGPIPQLPLPLRPFTYILSAWRLRYLKKQLGIDVTISNLWRADLINILSGGKDRKIALCHINVVGNASNRLMIWLRPFVAAIYRRFDRVIAVSKSLALELKALYRLPPGRIGNIDNFVLTPSAVSRLPTDGVQRFVWCGRFSPEKNVEGLLHAWATFAVHQSAVQLVLLGDGPLHNELSALVTSLGLRSGSKLKDVEAQVVFTGRVSDSAAYMLGARALLLSSHAEGLPMVVLEALSLGLPVLASDCQAGGVRTALLGHGTCNPDRTDIEYTPAGVLLPVPNMEFPNTLTIWAEVLHCITKNNALHRSICLDTILRSKLFSPEVAYSRWCEEISSIIVNR